MQSAGRQSSSHQPPPTPPPGQQLHSASRSRPTTPHDSASLAVARSTGTSTSRSTPPARSSKAALETTLRQTLEAQLTPALDELPDKFNFWAPGGVSSTVKRLESGGLLVDRLERILAARAVLEQHVASQYEQ